MIAAGSKTTSEYRFLDSERPELGFRCFAERARAWSTPSTTRSSAARTCSSCCTTRAARTSSSASRRSTRPRARAGTPLIAHDPAVRLEDVDAFAGHLVVHQRSRGLTQLRILELGEHGTGDDYLVEFDHEVYTVGSGGNPNFAQPTVRLGYTTMAVPSSVYDYDVRSRS